MARQSTTKQIWVEPEAIEAIKSYKKRRKSSLTIGQIAAAIILQFFDEYNSDAA